jgi:hypothetical protein
MKLLSGIVFSLPLAAARSSSKTQYVKNLVRGAFPTSNSQLPRRLDQAENYEINIASYFVKFEQCQFVKSYSDELAMDEDIDTVLYTSRFVLFKLCPEECTTCSSGYGEYLVDLETYLQATVEFFKDDQEEMCNSCAEQCVAAADDAAAQDGGDDAAVAEDDGIQDGGRKLYTLDCTTCNDDCQKIENMQANGYIDATDFLQCTLIYDPEDDNKLPLYAGPICASGGSKIKIGVFTDENCMTLDSTKEVDDYVQSDENTSMKLSHALLKSTYTDTCISCKEQPDANGQQQNENDQNDVDEVIEMCEDLYDAAAKCETVHGFANGYANIYGYENQIAQESTVCDFMDSIKAGTYDEGGEIVVRGASSVGTSKSTTGGQKFALTFFILGTLGLAVYAAMLHSKLVKGGKSDLATSGAMA